MRLARLGWIALACLSLAGRECLANFSIDPFSTASTSDQFVQVAGGATGPLSAQNGLADPSVAGGVRNITVTRTSNNRGSVSADVSESVPGFFSYNSSNQTTGTATLVYDGFLSNTTSTPNFSQGGLGNQDVTQAGVDKGVLFQADANVSVQVTFSFYTDANDYDRASFTIPGTTSEPVANYFIPFASFAEVGTASLTDVNAITVLIDGTSNLSTDVGINYIATAPAAVPEPASLSMVAVGLAAAATSLSVRPGSRRSRG